MADNSLDFWWSLRGTVEQQIKDALKNTENLTEAIEKLNVDLSKFNADKIKSNIEKNVNEAEKSLYKLYEAKEKIDKALSRNTSMRQDGFAGMDEAKLLQISSTLDDIIGKIMNIGAEAGLSRTAVKDLMSQLSAGVVLKEAKGETSLFDKGLDKQVRERAKAQKEAAREVALSLRDADKEAENNVKNQERIKDALAKIATARANLSAASEKGNQQEIAHAQLLMRLLDNITNKLTVLQSKFLGEKGALDGVLGSTYSGLMRNVGTTIKNIGNVDSSVVQSAVRLFQDQDTTGIRNKIDLVAALQVQIGRLYEELGRAANNANRIMPTNWQELAGKGIYNSKLPYVEQMEFLKKLRAYDGDMASQRSIVEENIKRLQSQLEVYQKAGINIQGYRNQLNALYETYSKLEALKPVDMSEKLGLGHLRGYTGPQAALSDEAWQAAKREAEVREVAIEAAERHKKKLIELTEAFDRQAKAEEKARQEEANAAAAKERATKKAHQRAQASAETERGLRKEAQSLVQLRLEILKTQATQLQSLIKNGKDVFNDSQLQQYRDALREVVNEMTTLKSVLSNISGFSSKELFGFGHGNNRMGAANLITTGQQALDASRAMNLLSDSERKFVQSLTEANTALSRQGSLMSDLKMMTTQYLSLWGARSFLNSIIETGGLLEQQRLSIGAILGSIDKANVIFGKIKDLAIKSPFGVVELDKMSKQLTAYGFQYEELFDWTKRLADISAATGTEVSRLALALGHVRAEGALSGYTLRQFAMGNIPLLQKLSENLGITTKEVREKTRRKEIGYEDVKAVLKQLTDEGGMFYNAQEVMSQALNAKLKNLRDAFDIMYGEIAESGVGDLLKKIFEALTAGAKEWKRYGTDMMVVAGAFVLMKSSVAAYRAGIVALSREMGILAINTRAYTAEQVKELALEGAVTREQLLRAVASKRLSVEQARLAATTLGVSEASLKEVATSGVVRKALLGNAMATSRFTVAQLRLIATLKAQGALFPVLRVGLMGLGVAIRTVGAAMKTFLPFLAIGAVIDFFSRYSQQLSSAKESAQDAASAISTGLGDVKSLYDSLNKKPPQGDTQLTTAVANMKDSLKEIGAYDSVKAQVEGTKDLQEQYNILYKRLQDISEEYIRMKYNAEAYFEAANNVGGGLFTDSMEKDIKQYGAAVVKKDVARGRADQYASVFKKELKKRLQNEGKWVEETMKDMDWDKLLDFTDGQSFLREVMQYNERQLYREGNKEAELYKDASEAMRVYIQELKKLSRARREVDNQMPEYAEHIKLGLSTVAKAKGLDLSKMESWSDDELRSFINDLEKLLVNYKVPEEVKETLKKGFISYLPESVKIRIDALPNKKPEQLEGWQDDLQKYFDDHKINIKLSADDTIQSVEKKLQEARENAQKKMKSAGAILTFWKIKPDMSEVNAFGAKHPLLKSLIESVFGDYTSAKNEVEAYDQTHKDTGLDVTKDKKTGGSKSDKRLKAWKEELKEIENFYKIYKRNAEYMSKDDAIQKALDSGVFSDPKKLPKNIDDYLNVLRSFRSKVEAKLGKKPSTERRSFLTDLITKIDEKEFEVKTKDAADKAIRKIQDYLSKQTEHWNLYKALLEKTGDKDFAQNAFRNGVVWDELSNELAEKLQTIINTSGKKLSVSSLLGRTDKEAEEMLKDVYGGYDLWKKITDLVSKNYTDALNKGADAMQKQLTIAEKIANIDAEIARLQEQNSTTDERGVIQSNNARIFSMRRERADLQDEQFKQSASYMNFFGAVLTMAGHEAENTGRTIKDMLTKQLAEGRITAHQFTKSMKEVNEQLAKSRTVFKGDFMTFLSGGQNGLVQKREEGVQKWANEVELAQKKVEEAQKNGNAEEEAGARVKLSLAQEELENAKKALEVSLKQYQTLSKMSNITGVIKGVFDGFKSIASSLSEMYDALGNDELADMFSDLADTISGIGSILTPVDNLVKNAMSGNVSGVVSSAISAPVDLFTGPITAFAKLHDKQLQREIEASKQRMKEMQSLSSNLEKALERALGGIYNVENTEGGQKSMKEFEDRIAGYKDDYYNTMQRIKELREANEALKKASASSLGKENEYYQNAIANNLTTISALESKYSNIGSDTLAAITHAIDTGKYYDQQLAGLYLQRDELKKQISSEEDKKDSDSGAINDYKQQIKELEDQIQNFALDMAKALYDIDLKSWASELTDAIVTAWENGEDAAEAYTKRVKELMKDLTKNILNKKVIEQAFANAGIDTLIANLMNSTSGELNYDSVGQIADALFSVGEASADAITAILDDMERKGYIEKGSSSTANKVIQGGFTENETGLLLSYVNAIRADVSMQRTDVFGIRQLLEKDYSQMPVLAQAQLTQLQMIATNTGKNVGVVQQIYDLLHKVAPDGQRIQVS